MGAPTILVAEDDSEMRELIRGRLVRAGYEVICARDGMEAMLAIRRRSIDVLVTDVYMPGKDGHELINYLRNANSGARVVAITGEGCVFEQEMNLTVAQTLGAHAALLKPFTMDELLGAVGAVLAAGRPSGVGVAIHG